MERRSSRQSLYPGAGHTGHGAMDTGWPGGHGGGPGHGRQQSCTNINQLSDAGQLFIKSARSIIVVQ